MAKKKAPTLKKHVNAVHIKGELSLLQRKLANALLFHAYPMLPIQDRYEIELRYLCGLIGYAGNDWAALKEALEGLQNVKMQWNLLNEKGRESWGSVPLLGGVKIEEGLGICQYAYDPFLREKLYNPEIYATINLDIQKKFGSKYALALYENCVRFRDVGSTGWMALEVFRQLLGCDGQSHYDDFKQLNQKVIKPAVKEVNETSDIEVQPEYKRSSRKVSEIRMKIADKRNLPPLGASPSQLRPADEKARIDAMADAVAAREKEAKTKEVAMKTLKEIRAALGIPERKEPES